MLDNGDCSLIITPKGKTILIDGGGNDNYNIGDNVLIPFLLKKGINTIDYIFISHMDSDHVKGILTVMEKLTVKNVTIGIQYEKSTNYEEFIKIINIKKIRCRVVKKQDVLKIENNLYFDILWPDNNQFILENILNNNSMVCKLNYKSFSMLFTGDIEEKAEQKILNEYGSCNNLNILKSTVLKVGHHGSKTSSSDDFIKEVNPKYVFIGVGKNNKFGHPSKEIISKFENNNVKIYRTDIMGEITILVSESGKIKFKKFIS